jgi:hypothetical protein
MERVHQIEGEICAQRAHRFRPGVAKVLMTTSPVQACPASPLMRPG